MQGYDLIGDIHGCAATLRLMLATLGYQPSEGLYRHPQRRLIFVGDFIDRGPRQRETLEIVRPLVEEGLALTVMGNHEFNALAYHTPDGNGGYLRAHSAKNQKQHQAFLDEFEGEERRSALDWFMSLPMFLELAELRVVHACWASEFVDELGQAKMTPERLRQACVRGSETYQAVDVLLKGWEVDLPQGTSFSDKDGHRRTRMRSRWWAPEPRNFKEATIEIPQENLPDVVFPEPDIEIYGPGQKNVFVGHYWLKGEPELLAPNVCCLDYSVGKGGELVAYRWSGEPTLTAENFVAVANQDYQ